MRRALSVALVAMGLVPLVSGCDDGEVEDDPCDAVEGRCEQGGARRCSEGTVERCEEDVEGCLRWVEEEPCGPHQLCRGEGDEVACACDDGCDELGSRTCDGDVIVECVNDAEGCLFLEGQQNCERSNQTCGTIDGQAACVGCLGDRCDEVGALRCLRQIVQRCEEQDDGCLDWGPLEDCGALAPPAYCRDEGGAVECVEECVDNCVAAGERRCSGEVIEVCVVQGFGCLDWEEGSDCAVEADYCDDSGAEAECVSCDDRCASAGETRCAGSVVETCVADSQGCRSWERGVDCATLDPVQLCELSGGAASCIPLEGDGSCDSPIFVTVPHYQLSGTSFIADFTNDHRLTGAGCRSADATVDAVFAVDLSAGETLRVREPGDLDAVLSLQVGACGDSVACEFSEDLDEVTGRTYTATADERVFVIVETFDPAPRTIDYEIRIDVVEPELCAGAVDEDGDGAVDCDDSDCFAEAPCSDAELNCEDGGDNDGDGAVDCDDSDCAGLPACGAFLGIFEEIFGADPMDLEGHLITFTPDAGEPHGYRWTVTERVGFPIPPSTGTTSIDLSLEDDDAESYLFALLPSFPFYGTSHTSMFVNSNGYLSFGGWSVSFYLGLEDLFEYPSVAALMTDLAPNLASTVGEATVRVDEFVDQVVVTYQNVPYWYDEFAGYIEGPNDFQISLKRDGTIQIYWHIVNAWEGIAGIANGVGLGDYPDEVDLIP